MGSVVASHAVNSRMRGDHVHGGHQRVRRRRYGQGRCLKRAPDVRLQGVLQSLSVRVTTRRVLLLPTQTQRTPSGTDERAWVQRRCIGSARVGPQAKVGCHTEDWDCGCADNHPEKVRSDFLELRLPTIPLPSSATTMGEALYGQQPPRLPAPPRTASHYGLALTCVKRGFRSLLWQAAIQSLSQFSLSTQTLPRFRRPARIEAALVAKSESDRGFLFLNLNFY
jgi:hypothetical protein